MQRKLQRVGKEGIATSLFLAILVSTVKPWCPLPGFAPVYFAHVNIIPGLLVWE